MGDLIPVFLFFFAFGAVQITTSISRRNLPNADIIVDVDKDYALERFGKYSPKLDEQLAHIFVSLNDGCVSSPSADVCAFAAGSPKANMLELITMLADRSTLTSFDRDSVAQFIGRSLSKSLLHYRPDETLHDFQAVTHLINDEASLGTNADALSPLSDSSNGIDLSQQQAQDDQQIPQFSLTTPATILTH